MNKDDDSNNKRAATTPVNGGQRSYNKNEGGIKNHQQRPQEQTAVNIIETQRGQKQT